MAPNENEKWLKLASPARFASLGTNGSRALSGTGSTLYAASIIGFNY